MMTTHQEDPPVNNGIKPLIKWELVWLVVQFIVLASAIVFNYASTTSKLMSLEQVLEQHITQHNQYLRVDVWQTRNQFIDSKLDRIENKLDLILMQQQKDTDRTVKGR